MSAPIARVIGEDVPASLALALAFAGTLCCLSAAQSWRASASAPVPRRELAAPAKREPPPQRAPIPTPLVVRLDAPVTPDEGAACAADTIVFRPRAVEPAPATLGLLSQLGAWLGAHHDARATVDGHADGSGDPTRNVSLSRQRAYAVSDQLVAHGARVEQLKVRWFGAFAPLDDRHGQASENRRVVIQIQGEACPRPATERAAP